MIIVETFWKIKNFSYERPLNEPIGILKFTTKRQERIFNKILFHSRYSKLRKINSIKGSLQVHLQKQFTQQASTPKKDTDHATAMNCWLQQEYPLARFPIPIPCASTTVLLWTPHLEILVSSFETHLIMQNGLFYLFIVLTSMKHPLVFLRSTDSSL